MASEPRTPATRRALYTSLAVAACALLSATALFVAVTPAHVRRAIT